MAVTDQSGVGKSCLAHEFTRSHRAQDWLILEARSVSYGKATSYLPAIDPLKGDFKVTGRDTQRETREKVTGTRRDRGYFPEGEGQEGRREGSGGPIE